MQTQNHKHAMLERLGRPPLDLAGNGTSCSSSVETITNVNPLWRQKNGLTKCCHSTLSRLAAAPRLLPLSNHETYRQT